MERAKETLKKEVCFTACCYWIIKGYIITAYSRDNDSQSDAHVSGQTYLKTYRLPSLDICGNPRVCGNSRDTSRIQRLQFYFQAVTIECLISFDILNSNHVSRLFSFFRIQMCPFALFLSVDPSLGRVDYRLLSDQTLMEMFIEGLDEDTENKYQDSEGMYLDVCDWSCIECDDDDRVIEIHIGSGIVSGSLEMRYLPPKVQRLNLAENQLTGEIDLKQLPDRVQSLDLSDNQLTGEMDLTRLPDGMERLELSSNRFIGEIDLTGLPDGMNGLYLNNNQFTGEIDLTQLPTELRWLDVSRNQLSGSIIINELPGDMFGLDLGKNRFNAVAVVESVKQGFINLKESGVMTVVDESGREVDMKRFL